MRGLAKGTLIRGNASFAPSPKHAIMYETLTGHVVIASITAALSLILALLFVTVAQAPGWRHYRTYSLIALASSAYALLAIGSTQSDASIWQGKLSASISLMLALSSVICWLRFDSQQEERALNRSEKIASYLLFAGTLLCFIPSVMISGQLEIYSAWFDLLYHIPATTALADFFIVILLLAMGQLIVRYAHRAWTRGDSWIPVAASLIFTGGALEEGLVVTGTINWPFLAPIAFTLGILFMAMDLGVRVALNANKLASLNLELEERITNRTEELVIAREALMSTERHTAIGRLAASVGHEVNNPLSYVKGNLDYLREQILAADGNEEDAETLIAIDDAMQGAERIRQVVDNLSTYARSAPVTRAAHVNSAVDVAMRVVRPQSKFTMLIEVHLDDVPPVAINESKLIQVLVNLLINAAKASRDTQPTPTTSITARQENGQVVIEITDHGCGMPEATVQQAFQPVTENHKTDGSTGLGLFLCHSLVEAAGGSIQIHSKVGTGTSIQLYLDRSGQEPPSISEPIAKSSNLIDSNETSGSTQSS